jgi:hypothetical protein
VNTGSVIGGVSIGGKLHNAAQTVIGGTLLTKILNRFSTGRPEEVSWSADNRQFITFNVETDLPVAAISPDIENEPVAAAPPESGGSFDKTWVLVFLVAAIALVVAKRRRRA